MSSFPVEIAGRRFTVADFAGGSYAAGYPSLLQNFSEQSVELFGFLVRKRIHPTIGPMTLTLPKNLSLAPGELLGFSAVEGSLLSYTYLSLTFAFRVFRYNRTTGVAEGQIDGYVDVDNTNFSALVGRDTWVVFHVFEGMTSTPLVTGANGTGQYSAKGTYTARQRFSMNNPATHTEFFEDFLSLGLPPLFKATTSGNGIVRGYEEDASAAALISTARGLVQLQASAVNSFGKLCYGLPGVFSESSGTVSTRPFECTWGFYLPVLSNGTNRFKISMGLRSGQVGPLDASGSAFMVSYVDDENTGRWTIYAGNSTGGYATVNTTSTVATGHQSITVKSNAGNLQVMLNGASIQLGGINHGQHSEPMSPMMHLHKEVGSGAVNVYADYLHFNSLMVR